MKRFGIVVLILAAFGAGLFARNIRQEFFGGAVAGMEGGSQLPASGEKEPLYWVAPMDPNYRRDKPGKSPMGMDLVPVYEEDQQGSDDGVVKISPVVVNNLGVRVAPVESGELELPIETVGYVTFDEERLEHIHGRVDGWIEVLNVSSEGDPVKKGQTLYELYSPTLVNAQEEYLAALRSGNAGLRSASRTRLLSLGLMDAQINRLDQRKTVDQRIRVVARNDGIVSQLNVRQGMFIRPATEVMAIGTLDSVWVIAEVFERQASWVKPEQPVTMTVAAVPGRIWEGQVDYLYPVLDSKTRTLRVRIRFDNPEHALKPNMFANLTLFSKVADQTLSIPREALIRGGRFDRVVVEVSEGQYRSVLVKTGVEAAGKVQILEGLSASDRVVVSAQFLIDSESNIDAEIARMEESSSDAIEEVKVVRATGTVEKVMTGMGMLNVNHDPIDAWKWPSMKMDFSVAESVRLDELVSGQRIEFELTKTGEWDYQITDIFSRTGTATAAEPALASMAAEVPGSQVIATGEIGQLMADMKMVEVIHDPIPEWQWPTMRMTFSVTDPSVLDTFKPGDRIRFTLAETEDGDYLLSNPENLNP